MRGRKLLFRLSRKQKRNQKVLASYNVWMKAVACLTTLDRQKTGKDSNVNYKSDSDRFAAVDNFTQDDEFSYRGIQVLYNGYNVEEDEKKKKKKKKFFRQHLFFLHKKYPLI